MSNKKICAKCKQEKAFSDFYRNQSRADKVGVHCKQCHLKETENRRLLKKYGITLAEYHIMLQSQGGRCKICQQSGKRKLAVDHDHQKNEIRGLLCYNCNAALGYFKENPDIIRKAISYLESNDRIPIVSKRPTAPNGNCTVCQTPILSFHGLRKYCSECLREIVRERDRARYRKRHG